MMLALTNFVSRFLADRLLSALKARFDCDPRAFDGGAGVGHTLRWHWFLRYRSVTLFRFATIIMSNGRAPTPAFNQESAR